MEAITQYIMELEKNQYGDDSNIVKIMAKMDSFRENYNNVLLNNQK